MAADLIQMGLHPLKRALSDDCLTAGFLKGSRLGLLLMASGWSNRFGRNKLLAKINGKMLIEYALQQAILPPKSNFSDSFPLWEKPLLLTRYAEVKAIAAQYPVTIVDISGQAQSDTIRQGLSQPCTADWIGCIFLAADQPLLKRETLIRLAAAFRHDPKHLYRLGYGKERGMPTVFPACYFPSLRGLSGDHGGGELLRNSSDKVQVISADSQWELFDIDTEEDIAVARQQMELQKEGH